MVTPCLLFREPLAFVSHDTLLWLTFGQALTGGSPTYLGIPVPFNLPTLLAIVRTLTSHSSPYWIVAGCHDSAGFGDDTADIALKLTYVGHL
jgi:hypothetical protein